MKKNTWFSIYVILTILWIGVIFAFSLQDGEESGALSGGIVAWFIEAFHVDALMEPETFHFLVRKAAHFTEYAILGVLMSLTWYNGACASIAPAGCDRRHASANGTSTRRRFLLLGTAALLCCVLVASCDETIQLFVGGRAGQVADVLLDSTGAAAGIAVMAALSRIRKR